MLTNNQHGFGRGRSSETRLAGLIDDHAQILDRKSQNDLVILDFIKAFDTVPHQWLMSKLENIGIDNSFLSWIETFLTQRHQKVLLGGATPSQASVTSGVPQGTVLGPLLFLLYINDLSEAGSSQTRLFAIDCIMYREIIKSLQDSIQLQKDIDACSLSVEKISANVIQLYVYKVLHHASIL